MPLSSLEKQVRRIFAEADIEIGGGRASDIRVKDSRFYARFLRDGTLGLGESYMDEWWDCADLAEMMARFSKAKLALKFRRDPKFILSKLRARLSNQGSRGAALAGVRHHYDIGNDLYEAMLGPTMAYTCAVWDAGAKDVTAAQNHKLELLCRKLVIAPGMRVLDIGCGWGSFAKYAATRYGARVTGISLSAAQLSYAEESCRGLDVDFKRQDYRDIEGSYDRVLSVGMFEHVCYRNHRAYMETTRRVLRDDGIALLHSMGRRRSVARGSDQWITRHIFPNTQVPSVRQIGNAIEDLWVVEDWENLGVNYEKTLLAWFDNFDRAWPSLEAKYGSRFYRMWKYYLLIFAGWYRSRALQLWQIVLSPDGVPGGYSWARDRMKRSGVGDAK